LNVLKISLVISNDKVCLHPDFMAHVAYLLTQGSVNVIIPKMGHEAERFVSDIRQYKWDKQIIAFHFFAFSTNQELFQNCVKISL